MQIRDDVIVIHYRDCNYYRVSSEEKIVLLSCLQILKAPFGPRRFCQVKRRLIV